jgi:hypothetical protein
MASVSTFVGCGSITEDDSGIGTSRRQKDGRLDQGRESVPLIGAPNECGEKLADCVRYPVFPDAMLPRQDLKPPLVQQWSDLIEEELQVAL